MSVTMGNLVQLVGMALGALLLYLAANVRAPEVVRVALMLIGILAIYDCCHAIFHWRWDAWSTYASAVTA